MSEPPPSAMQPVTLRVGAYLDQAYWEAEGGIVAQRSFVLFLNRLHEQFRHLTLFGRLAAQPARGHYPIAAGVEFVRLPDYTSGAKAGEVARAFPGSLRRFWLALDELDVLWLLGPSVLSVAFALIAALRRRPVVLGVRQDLPTYARARHPGRRSVLLAAWSLEGAFRALARRRSVVVVGSELARHYRNARSVLSIAVSLIARTEIVTASQAAARRYDIERLTALAVTRLDAEKNPLLMADVLAQLRTLDPRWQLVVCGEGPLRPELARRLEQLGVAPHAELLGHVGLDGGLPELYRRSHALLHVSWTEGVPQVLFEAFAAGLPVVATAVGGVADAAQDAALLIDPADADAAAHALSRIGTDHDLRARLVERGLERVRSHSIETEAGAVAQFIAAAAAGGRLRRRRAA